MKQENLTIIYLPLKALHEYENNSKKHDRQNVDAIKASIERFGNCDPIGVWTDGNKRHVIVEGHGRRQALEELGYTEAPCILLNHLTDEERKAYGLAHNKTTLMTGFDMELLMQELDELSADFNMEDFGFAEMEDFDFAVEDFGGVAERVEAEEFAMTFNFPIEYEEEVKAYVKEIGKDGIVNMIIAEAGVQDA